MCVKEDGAVKTVTGLVSDREFVLFARFKPFDTLMQQTVNAVFFDKTFGRVAFDRGECDRIAAAEFGVIDLALTDAAVKCPALSFGGKVVICHGGGNCRSFAAFYRHDQNFREIYAALVGGKVEVDHGIVFTGGEFFAERFPAQFFADAVDLDIGIALP